MLLSTFLTSTYFVYYFYLLGRMLVIMSALVMMSLSYGTEVEPSIANIVFLPCAFDPFCDIYVETVTRMSADELMHLPKLNDTEFLDQLVRGVDAIPCKNIYKKQIEKSYI
jgi:hypothetical protein